MQTTPLVLCAALLCASASASAGLADLIKKPGLSADAGSGASADAGQIVNRYVAGTRHVLQANGHMLAAVGMKEEAGRAEVQAANLKEGATRGALQDAAKVQSDSSAALEQQLEGKKIEMSAAAKKQFTRGVVDLARGAAQYVAMRRDAAGYKPGPADLGQAAVAAIHVASSLPGSVQGAARTLKLAIAFCKANDIPVPREANDATGML